MHTLRRGRDLDNFLRDLGIENGFGDVARDGIILQVQPGASVMEASLVLTVHVFSKNEYGKRYVVSNPDGSRTAAMEVRRFLLKSTPVEVT